VLQERGGTLRQRDGSKMQRDVDGQAVPQAFKDYFKSLYAEAYDILIQRQEGYGPSNIENLGAYGVYSRLAFDKCSRIATNLNGKISAGEATVNPEWYSPAMRDALLDIANYAMIMIALGEHKWSETARAIEGEEG
jgi:hypothetical protein